MIITNDNRKSINNKEQSIHDAFFYLFENKYVDGKYYYTLRADGGWKHEEEFILVFSGVTSCKYIGERHSNILGNRVNSWYSLPSYPYGSLASDTLSKKEIEEIEMHGIYKNYNIRDKICVWEHELSGSSVSTDKLFRIVFFFPTPAFLEIECETLEFDKKPKETPI